jgi:DNA-binding PadR family transcriptional regulator
MPKISATTAAILGQLAWREQSTYELAKAMGRNLHFFWPRAESHTYREIKRVVSDGLATAHKGSTGRRPRTTYRITPKGERALHRWLASQSGGISLENEPLLRIFLGSHGTTKTELLQALDAAQDHAAQIFTVATQVADEYLDHRHEFQDQVHLRAFIFDYLWNSALFTQQWAQRARAEIERWQDLTPTPAKHRRALKRIRFLANDPSRRQPPPIAGTISQEPAPMRGSSSRAAAPSRSHLRSGQRA